MLHSLRFQFYNSHLIMCKKMQLVDAQYCLKKIRYQIVSKRYFQTKKIRFVLRLEVHDVESV